MADISKETEDTNIEEATGTDEHTIIKNKKFESRANYAGNEEVIDEDLDEELEATKDK